MFFNTSQEGFEPPTVRLEGECSILLSYYDIATSQLYIFICLLSRVKRSAIHDISLVGSQSSRVKATNKARILYFSHLHIDKNILLVIIEMY